MPEPATVAPFRITRADAWSIYDSRGRPTIAVELATAGASATGIAPTGASRGRFEAHELRDADGGVTSACTQFANEIAPRLRGLDCREQARIDTMLVETDGTEHRERLGGNTLIATSMAVLQLAAAAAGEPLWRMLDPSPGCMPLPQIQIFGGGAHAGGRLPLQDFMILPLGASDWPTALAWAADVYRAAGKLLADRGLLQGVADEGGFWPNFPDCASALDLLVEAIERAGRRPLEEIAISLDIAANQFWRDRRYCIDGDRLESAAWLQRLQDWTRRYPVLMVEDPCAEEDASHYADFARSFMSRGLVVGDDLVVSNAARIRDAVAAGRINAALVKPNQVGTISEARAALDACPVPIVSARSGETEDTCIVDLAVGWQAPIIKVGSITRGERTAKWNRGLRIHRERPLPLAPFRVPPSHVQPTRRAQ
jgi:enolase